MDLEKNFEVLIHEIKNSVQGIVLNAEILDRFLKKNDSVGKRTMGLSKRLKDQSHNLYKLVVNSGFLFDNELRLESFDFHNLIRDVLEETRYIGDRDRIKIKTEYDLKLTEVKQDRERLKVILKNIVKNGLEESPPGDNLVIRTRSEGEYMVVEISNHGDMIPKEKLKTIFEAHYSTKEEGFGLGLAIAKHLVELLKGEIHVDSEPSETTFTVKIPKELKG